MSPYFFNSGLFCTGLMIYKLAQFYCSCLVDNNLEFDVIFGPAYKGIPLSCCLALMLYEKHNRNEKYCFNRKERKDHGEGGLIVGSEMKGRVLVVDDVITAGTAIKESVQIIKSNNATMNCVLIALDRQEKADGSDKSAIQMVQDEHGCKVVAICTLSDILEYLEQVGGYDDHLIAIKEYRKTYGIS